MERIHPTRIHESMSSDQDLRKRPASAHTARAGLLARVASVVARARKHTAELDLKGSFPTEDVAALCAAGALTAVLPQDAGGLGVGTDPRQALLTAELLYRIGAGSIALARLYEAHLNAIRLAMRDASEPLRSLIAQDVRAGHLFALWVTDGEKELRYRKAGTGIRLEGQKSMCSAAGHATRAVVTARDPSGDKRLLVLSLGCGEKVVSLANDLQGVRSAVTGRVEFADVDHPADVVFGDAAAYLREPDFSTGAWRTSAITAGALSSLIDAARSELVSRNRTSDPQQLDRLGRMMIHAKTTYLWVHHIAPVAERADENPERAVATVNLARIAIEAACLDTIQLVQRSLGLSAFIRINPVERMCRDLATYLRQPAADAALNEAAAYFSASPMSFDLFGAISG
jgi:alkylation response protein AidB-like acyl-CoA dehydrogenase